MQAPLCNKQVPRALTNSPADCSERRSRIAELSFGAADCAPRSVCSLAVDRSNHRRAGAPFWGRSAIANAASPINPTQLDTCSCSCARGARRVGESAHAQCSDAVAQPRDHAKCTDDAGSSRSARCSWPSTGPTSSAALARKRSLERVYLGPCRRVHLASRSSLTRSRFAPSVKLFLARRPLINYRSRRRRRSSFRSCERAT